MKRAIVALFVCTPALARASGNTIGWPFGDLGGGGGHVDPDAPKGNDMIGVKPDPTAPTPWLELHLYFGIELTADSATRADLGRIHAGFGHAFGSGTLRPSIVLGVTAAGGVVDSRADGRGLGSVSEYAPELQLGLRFVNGGWVDSRVYATFAPVAVRHFDRFMDVAAREDAPPAALAQPWRLGVGYSWADRVSLGKKGDRVPEAKALHGWWNVLIPRDAEITLEHAGPTNELCMLLGYGI